MKKKDFFFFILYFVAVVFLSVCFEYYSAFLTKLNFKKKEMLEITFFFVVELITIA